MADEEKVETTAEVTEKVETEDRDETQERTYTRDEYRKILSEKKAAKADRDKLEAELTKYREAEEKAKKEKSLADGKAKELLEAREKELEEAKKRLKSFEEDEKKMRTELLGLIKDKDIREIGEKLPTSDLRKLVEKESKESVFSGKTKLTGGPDPKKMFDPSQYKDIREYEKALRDAGMA